MNSSKCWISPSMLRYVAVGLRKRADEVADQFHHGVGRVVHQAADAAVARVVALPGGRLEDVGNLLPLVEGVKERGERSEVEGRGTDTQQMVGDAGQFC